MVRGSPPIDLKEGTTSKMSIRLAGRASQIENSRSLVRTKEMMIERGITPTEQNNTHGEYEDSILSYVQPKQQMRALVKHLPVKPVEGPGEHSRMDVTNSHVGDSALSGNLTQLRGHMDSLIKEIK